MKILTETIDWQAGDDPQYWTVVPLTVGEAEELMAQGEAVDGRRIEEIGGSRRYLQADYPGGGVERIRWAEGPLLIGPHD